MNKQTKRTLTEAIEAINWSHGRGDIQSIDKETNTVTRRIPITQQTGYTETRKFRTKNGTVHFLGHSRVFKKELFPLPDTGRQRDCIQSLHVWEWLKSQGIESTHAINTKKEYLNSLGFDVSRNYISEKNLELIKIAINHYGWSKVRGYEV